MRLGCETGDSFLTIRQSFASYNCFRLRLSFVGGLIRDRPNTTKDWKEAEMETGDLDVFIGLPEYMFVLVLRYPIELCF